MSSNGQVKAIGTEMINGKFVISDPKKFLPVFVILSIIGLPILVGMALWVFVTA